MAETTQPKLRVSEKEASEKIQVRIEKGQQLRCKEIRSEDELEKARAESRKWSDYNKTLLSTSLFDNGSIAEDEYTDFNEPRRIRFTSSGPTPFSEKLELYQRVMNRSINSLEGIHERLELYAEPSETSQSTFGNEVFIVHGHDDEAKVTVARFVEHLGVKVTILDEEVNEGRTIPEKFEEHAGEAGYAIVLLTPDDVGSSKDETDNPQPRARQNVVLEFGYFWGKLGRKRLCVLYKEGIELPSDMKGIAYVLMDNFDGWKQKLAKEMNRAKLPIDPQKLL